MPFPITITGRHIEITEPLRDYITEKIGRACKLLDKTSSAHVTVTVEKYRHIVEVDIQSHGAKLHAKEETHDMYSSIDQVLDKIEIQAKRLKEKIKDHKHQPEAPAGAGAADEEPAQHRPNVFVADSFAPKPLTVDEAVEDLQARPDAFLVFHNAKNGLVNVLYKRGDGTFGLVQPPA
jgi:putative sigma-54 modulation protein